MGTTCRRQILEGHLCVSSRRRLPVQLQITDSDGGVEGAYVGTFRRPDEGEVTEYLGCELVKDRKARTGQLIQAGYAERVLRVINMWDCNPVATPMDPNVRLSN